MNKRAPALKRLASRLGGARLVYGKPVRVGDRAVVPVARVRAGGGYGFGDSAEEGSGGGGGGMVDAQPAGFIDIGPEGSRFEAIPDPDRTAKLIKASAVAVATVLVATALRRRLAG